ncbi:5-oxoprolinase subunit PxpB [Shewanella sp. Isolate11]|uniref:5-oxoprolinase subunit PxpB n=1 Tax=Shewanella sp. Isolate11 TaxID=2908530 RepID=UPI001EFEEC4A|nr:5-oxoprolinase subunit PxpB [Shewanella sp. Isolate11]MCG9698122.1 5-oxoprolinase subunit PxpB [Shewanella sp. Isolate11]
MRSHNLIYPLGENALVLSPAPKKAIDFTLQTKLCWIAEQCRQSTDVINAVAGMNNLTVYYSHAEKLKAAESHLLTLYEQAQQQEFQQRHIDIPVIYGCQYGPDLDNVAKLHQLSTDEVIKRHSQAEYRVFFIGFKPGFAYLDGLPSSLHTPRLERPRLAVPAGSVGIGGEQTGFYPSQSPGGWQLIGRTELKLFNPYNAEPCLLHPGDIVRFIAKKRGYKC